jgi:hypothetical protein
VTRPLIQKENLRSMLNMLNIEGRVVVGNNDAKNIRENDNPKIEQHHKNLAWQKLGPFFERFFNLGGPRGTRQ